MPVSTGGFALFTQQDIGQHRKGVNFITNVVFLLSKYNWLDFYAIREQM